MKIRGIKRTVATLAIAATLVVGGGVAVPSTAEAAIIWPAPPTCSKTNSQWVISGSAIALATYAYTYEQKRFYGGGYEARKMHVYEMQQPNWWLKGMITVGRSEKVCGVRWVPINRYA